MESITSSTIPLGFIEEQPIVSIQPHQVHLDEQPITPVDSILGEEREITDIATLAESSKTLEPALGMEFDSPESARAFYSAYAEKAGFRFRNSKSFTSRVDDTVIMRRFVCSRQGRPTKKDPFDLTKKRRNRSSSREGCKAMLQVNRRENGRWAVSRSVLEHCHGLGVPPELSPAAQKKLAKKPWELYPSGETPTPQNGLGPGGGVAQSLLEHFKRMQTENPAFFYAVQVNSNNCIANVFWADARARTTYSCFGDTVVLDMTCKKNKRAVPFVAFTGFNQHRQLVVFGCAFLTDEVEASFTWLFETWVLLMSGHHPLSLVIPQNEAVAAAAVKVFPNVRHRLCKRDVFSKCKERLSDVYTVHDSFKSEFKKCVDESESIEEFEVYWRVLIGRYYLNENVWLRFLYDIRHKWVPAYFRGTFFGEFRGAPKIETMHKFFQRHSITTTTLRDLVTQFDKAMAGQYEKELQADFVSIHPRPALKTPSPLEKQASEIYTRTVFDLFQEELVESSGFLMDKVVDGVISKFCVTKAEDASKAYTVTYNASDNRISCSCCMFEFSGILCRHVFRVSLVVGILALPDDYILRRWTSNARSNISSYEHFTGIQESLQEVLRWRCNDLCRDAIRFAEEGATSAGIYKVAKGALQKALNEVFIVKKGSLFSGSR